MIGGVLGEVGLEQTRRGPGRQGRAGDVEGQAARGRAAGKPLATLVFFLSKAHV